MRADPPGRGGAPGFTLLEVLVAFVIASLGLAVLTRAGLDGVRSGSLAARYQEATARAQAHLAALGDAPAPSDRQGDEGDGFHWHVRITPLDSAAMASSVSRTLAVGAAAAGGPPRRVSLLAISVTVSWAAGLRRSVELDSERVVAGAVTDAP